MVIIAYLLGSIPTAYIAGRLLKRVDIRTLGDRNMGAANTYREIGPQAGVGVFVADVSKGALVVLITRLAPVSETVMFLSGVAVVAGHNWPVFLGFRGGRGAATAMGVLLALFPREMAILLAASAITLRVTRRVTPACAVSFASLPLIVWSMGYSVSLITYSIGIPSLVGFTHFLTTRHLPDIADGMIVPAENGNGEK
ncbi:glycerol-3-phosphate acyltransferase [Chloroflexota bacterium]